MRDPGSDAWALRLEFEGHEHTNRVKVNGQTVGFLPSQTWADMWMSAELPIPADLLRVGYNELTVEVGQELPVCQAPGNVWDELLFRRVRLESAVDAWPGAATPAIARGNSPVKIVVVFDNNSSRPDLATAWGFGCVVQHGDRTLLFDTGGDGQMLLANMAALGLDPSSVDTVVLSHEHADHTGGLAALLEINPDVTVYLPQAFTAGFKDRVRAAGARLVEVVESIEIVPGVWSTGQMGSGVIEQALVVRTESGLTIVTGCAHPGILEVVRKAREVGGGEINLVMGGFHLTGARDAALREIITGLRAVGVTHVAPCHCTGEAATRVFAEAYGTGYQRCGVGLVITGEMRERE